jgi:hypothetical protein
MTRRWLSALASLALWLPVSDSAFALGDLVVEAPPVARQADCADYGSIDAATGRAGTVCLPVSPIALRIRVPRVYCQGTTCVLLGTALADPGQFLGIFIAALGGKGGNENCRVYDTADPGYGNIRNGLLCLPLRLTDRVVFCTAGRCLAVDP